MFVYFWTCLNCISSLWVWSSFFEHVLTLLWVHVCGCTCITAWGITRLSLHSLISAFRDQYSCFDAHLTVCFAHLGVLTDVKIYNKSSKMNGTLWNTQSLILHLKPLQRLKQQYVHENGPGYPSQGSAAWAQPLNLPRCEVSFAPYGVSGDLLLWGSPLKFPTVT